MRGMRRYTVITLATIKYPETDPRLIITQLSIYQCLTINIRPGSRVNKVGLGSCKQFSAPVRLCTQRLLEYDVGCDRLYVYRHLEWQLEVQNELKMSCKTPDPCNHVSLKVSKIIKNNVIPRTFVTGDV
jgi:hypothetical protein